MSQSSKVSLHVGWWWEFLLIFLLVLWDGFGKVYRACDIDGTKSRGGRSRRFGHAIQITTTDYLILMWWGGSEFTACARGCLRTVRAYCFVVPWCCVCIYVVYEMVPGATATRQRFILVGHRRRQVGRGGRLTAMIDDAGSGNGSWYFFGNVVKWEKSHEFEIWLYFSSTYDAWASPRSVLTTRCDSKWVHLDQSQTLHSQDLCVSDVACLSSSVTAGERVEICIKIKN